MMMSINLVGFQDPLIASAIEKHLHWLVEAQAFDLSTVEEVTVAAEYGSFLANFDTGFTPRESLSATSGENSGVGITPEVLRNGALASHIILPQDYAFPLAYRKSEEFHMEAVYTLTHEAAHAEEHLLAARDYGEQVVVLHRNPDWYLCLARTCWGEYYASRRSGFSYPGIGKTLVGMFVIPADRFKNDLSQAAVEYKSTSDQAKLDTVVTQGCTTLFVHFSRLAGHFDGIDQEMPDDVTELGTFQENPGLYPHFVRLRDALRVAFDKLGHWGKLEAGLLPIIESFQELFAFVTS
jgi:hypothetical protein